MNTIYTKRIRKSRKKSIYNLNSSGNYHRITKLFVLEETSEIVKPTSPGPLKHVPECRDHMKQSITSDSCHISRTRWACGFKQLWNHFGHPLSAPSDILESRRSEPLSSMVPHSPYKPHQFYFAVRTSLLRLF